MNEFNEIMGLMNNGLDNDSTLAVSVPKIAQWGLKRNASVVGDIMNFIPPEVAMNRPHPGLDEVVTVLQNVIETAHIASNPLNTVDVEKEVVAKINY